MKKILLTGAGGFVGRWCLPELLARGYEVHAVGRRRPAAAGESPNCRWHDTDLLDPAAVAALVQDVQPTLLLHLAWYSVPGKFWSSLENLRWLQASLALIRIFAMCGGERVVAAGSCAEYSWTDEAILSERATRLSPTTLYGACKHALHLVLEALASQTNLSVAWGRVFFLYGPHEHPDRLTASVIRSLLRGEPAQCSEGRQVRDFLYVQDAAAALVQLLQSEVSGPVNIASGQGVTVKDLAGKIADIIGRADLLRFGERTVKTDEPAVLVADVKRLREEVGFQPKHSLDTGLRLVIQWWEQNLEQNGLERSNATDD